MRKMQRAATGGSGQRRGPPSASAGKSNPNGEPAYFASDPDRSAAAVARYVALLSGEMAVMARSANLDMLTYLLDMARAEAELIARTPPGGGADAANPAP